MTAVELDQKLSEVIERYWSAFGKKFPIGCVLLNRRDFVTLVEGMLGACPDLETPCKWETDTVLWRVHDYAFRIRSCNEVPEGTIGVVWW